MIANQTKSHFDTLSAVLAGKADLKEVIDKAIERRKPYARQTVPFVKGVLETQYSHYYLIKKIRKLPENTARTPGRLLALLGGVSPMT